MKAAFSALGCFALVVTFLGNSAVADVSVRGHFRKDGTYVAPHMRSSPNSTTLDNWSTKGNVNPYNGQVGTKNSAQGASASFAPVGSVPPSGTIQSSASYSGSTSPSRNELRSESSASTPKQLEIGSIQVGTGMTTVEWLLGKPERISDDGTGETWRYSNGAWVEFTASGYVYKAGGFDVESPKPNQEASSSDIDKLTERIVQLEAKVKELNAIIKNESQGSPSAFPSSNSSPTDNDAQPPKIDQWRTLKRDDPNKIQTMEYVVRVLGKPKSIKDWAHPYTFEPGERWEYNGGGYLQFNRNGVLTDFGGYRF
jgi:hypothetical protein